jgi:hypothetical protein
MAEPRAYVDPLTDTAVKFAHAIMTDIDKSNPRPDDADVEIGEVTVICPHCEGMITSGGFITRMPRADIEVFIRVVPK